MYGGIGAATIIGITLVIAAGCGGGGSEKKVDLGGGDEVTAGTDLPDDFPDDFPIYDGADLQGAVQGEQDGIEGIVATWTTSDGLDDVTDFYKDEFDGGSWVTTTTGSAGGSTYWAVEQSDGDKVGYVAVSGGDEVTIIATVGDDPNARSDTDASDSGSDEASSEGDEVSDDETSSDSDDGGAESANLPDEVDLPDGFPSDLVSFPDGTRVTTGQSYSASGQETFIVGFHTKASVEDVGDFYKSQLEAEGFTQSLQTSDANGVYAAYAEHADGTGTIIVISVNESSSVEGYREGVVQVTEG